MVAHHDVADTGNSKGGGDTDFAMIDDLAGLVWRQPGRLELHIPQWTVGPPAASGSRICWCST